LLSGCGEVTPVCDSLDSRNTVVKIISDDSNNALVNYAAKNSSVIATMVSNANTEVEKLAILEKARQDAAYRLGDTHEFNKQSQASSYLHWVVVCDRRGYDSAKGGRLQGRTNRGWEDIHFGQSVSILAAANEVSE
jgi:hypothetical protein